MRAAPATRDESSPVFVKSPQGLWVKAELRGDTIGVFVQERTQVREGRFEKLNPNGDVASSSSIVHMVYDEPYLQCGTIRVENTWLEECSVMDLDKLIYGVQRHVVRMIAGGWGDTPDEVVTWFNELMEGHFIAPAEYEVVGPEHGIFEGLLGNRIRFNEREAEDETVTGSIEGFGTSYTFEYEPREIVVPLLISTIPI